MKNTVTVCFLVFSFFTTVISCSSSYDDLTEEIVKTALYKIDNAVENMDADGVSDALSDDVIIVLNIKTQGQNEVIRPSKQEYIAMLKDGWSMSKNYKYTRSNLKIDIQGDKAIITADTRESMTVQGQHITSKVSEKVTMELINGKPLITNVVGHISM